MRVFITLTSVLMFITMSVEGQGFTFTILNMTQAKVNDKIPCPESCNGNIQTAMKIMSLVFDSAVKKLPFTVDFCDECTVKELNDFTYKDECFMNENKQEFDHQVDFSFPSASATCNCQLSRSPKATAQKVNSAKLPKGECGFNNYGNTHQCENIKCSEDEAGEDVPTNVTIKFNIPNMTLHTILRAETRSDRFTYSDELFPVMATMTTADAASANVEATGQFDQAWKCLQENQAGFYCKVFGNAWAQFFDCIDEDVQYSLVTAVLREYFTCKDYNKEA